MLFHKEIQIKSEELRDGLPKSFKIICHSLIKGIIDNVFIL